VKNAEAKEVLETVGRMFLAGYAYAVEAKHPLDAEEKLEQLPVRFRGFAYEGAGMGFAMLDGLPFGHSRHVDQFLEGRAADHVYMVYVGIGWAMARLPRFAWPSSAKTDPLLRWLVLDGYGFHQAYFKTDKYVWGQAVDANFPWPAEGPRDYTLRALDQGIGRAMWFVGGTDAERVADMIDKFPAHRREDLWGGAGLAATYAGGVTKEELELFRERAGEHAPLVAQGSAFAAEARIKAGLLVPHTSMAAQVFCDTSAEKAAQVTQDVRPAPPIVDGALPAFELWRQRIAAEFVHQEGVTS
jgi:enediyne biosynthesis protein E3